MEKVYELYIKTTPDPLWDAITDPDQPRKMILSGLKTWLETGELLTTPGSLMYT